MSAMIPKTPRFWLEAEFESIIIHRGRAVIPITVPLDDGNTDSIRNAAEHAATSHLVEMAAGEEMHLAEAPTMSFKVLTLFPSNHAGTPDYDNPIRVIYESQDLWKLE